MMSSSLSELFSLIGSGGQTEPADAVTAAQAGREDMGNDSEHEEGPWVDPEEEAGELTALQAGLRELLEPGSESVVTALLRGINEGSLSSTVFHFAAQVRRIGRPVLGLLPQYGSCPAFPFLRTRSSAARRRTWAGSSGMRHATMAAGRSVSVGASP